MNDRKLNGLSDKWQAIILMISAIFISIGTYNATALGNPQLGLLLGLIGAVGFGLKEVLGSPKQKIVES